jgi:4-diphosphocytidyl-2-C-methyl-D-erythritol kinase
MLVAPAKLNLTLAVIGRRPDGYHDLHSVMAPLALAAPISLVPTASGPDRLHVAGADVGAGPDNLVLRAVAALRPRLGRHGDALPPLAIRLEKRIPVAAGLGGGSADAAAVLRGANRVVGSPLTTEELRELAGQLGSDVPSQVDPRHELVSGVGEIVEPIDLPAFGAVLIPQAEGLAAAAVYAQFDLLGGGRNGLDAEIVRELADDMTPLPVLGNDLQPAALALRPELEQVLGSLRNAGALGELVSGSGPTCFGLFPDRAAAVTAAAGIDGAIAAALRSDAAGADAASDALSAAP